MIAVIKERHEILIAGGTGSANILKCSGQELIQVFTKATTGNTTYNLALIDEDAETIWSKTSITGTYEEHAILIPLRGVYTISITSASANEIIVVKLMIE
jgi:hypothetical protein